MLLHALGGETHVVAVCQPAVPVLAAAAVMEADNDPYVPISMTLMGGPIDTRVNPTVVNTLAERRGINWFRHNVITKVPFPNAGMMRDVYPGFLQLNGFVTINLDRHIEAHKQLFQNLVKGDGNSAHKHREFYDEYLAVMDLAADYYLQTVDTVFVRHLLPQGRMTHRGRPIELDAITRIALLTVEGEHDDISGVGQTQAAQRSLLRHSRRPQGALAAARRRPLRRVQRLAVPFGDRAAHFRFRADDGPKRANRAQRLGQARRRRTARRARAATAQPSRPHSVAALASPLGNLLSAQSKPVNALRLLRFRPVGCWFFAFVSVKALIRRRNSGIAWRQSAEIAADKDLKLRSRQ